MVIKSRFDIVRNIDVVNLLRIKALFSYQPLLGLFKQGFVFGRLFIHKFLPHQLFAGAVSNRAEQDGRLSERSEFPPVRHGSYAAWHENGTVREFGSYHEGERDGVWTRWYESGGKRAQAQFENGIQHGLLITWDATGDDGSTGLATSYDLRYSTSPITNNSTFNAAIQMPWRVPQSGSLITTS